MHKEFAYVVTVMVIASLLSGCDDDYLRQDISESDLISYSIAAESSGDRTRGTLPAGRYSAFRMDNGDMWVLEAETAMESNGYQPGLTRSTQSILHATDIERFFMHAYTYEGDGEWADNFGLARVYLSDEVSKRSDGYWSSSTPRYWPGDKYTMKFFGHAFMYTEGVDEEGNVVIESRDESEGAEIRLTKNWPSVKYNSEDCNDDLILTADLLSDIEEEEGSTYRETLPGDYRQPVKLHFYHPLTAVTFTADPSIEDDITSIKITSIRTVGKHTYGEDAWTFYDSSGVEYTKSSLEFPLTKSTDKVQQPKMVIPQELSTAVLSVEFADGTVLTKKISGRRWTMGTNLVYHISRKSSYTEYVLEGIDDISTSWMGGDIEVPIRSYAINTSVTSEDGGTNVTVEYEAVPWEASVKLPEWMTIVNSKGSGISSPTDDPEYFRATISKQSYTYSNEHNDNLQAAVSVSGLYDLSTNGGTTAQTTANCYLVNAPGFYSLPLVFGNAIVNGEVNTQAYKPSSVNGSGEKLANFKCYDRSNISTPYMYEQTYSTYRDKITDAILCWQDAENLVSNVHLDADGKNLIFYVSANSICQGNALVAVRDSKKRIMWSWHIWVTDYQLGTELCSVTNQGISSGVAATTRQFMPFNLGQCYEGTYKYDARKVSITIAQSAGTSTTTQKFTLNQKEHVFSPTNNTYYQWGRKDPMLPCYSEEEGSSYDALTGRYKLIVSDKTQYYDDETYKFSIKDATSNSADLAIAMQNPNVFFSSSSNWCNWMPVNLWNGTNLGDLSKTVYDPCPPGFAVPSAIVFTGFTRTGEAILNISVDDPGAVEKTFDEDINSYQRSIEDFARNFGFTFYCNPMKGVGEYDLSAGVIHFPVIGYRRGDSASGVAPSEVGHYCFLWSSNPDYGQRAAWYMMFGINETSIDIVPRALNEGYGGIAKNLAHGFSIRPVKEE